MARALVTFALIAALPLAAAGCSKRACFAWTAEEGACPSQAEAPVFFAGPPGCPDAVQSVDSEPDYDGELCCYDVSTGDSDEVPCYGGESGGSAVVTTTATGPVPGEPSCFGCSDALGGLSPPCADSNIFLNDLMNCMCVGACASACSMSSCSIPLAVDETCFGCLSDTASGCGNELNTCQNDFTKF
jgi:hypothetical protein